MGFKEKYYLDISIKRYKDCLITQSFFQVHDINYNKIFTSTIRQESLKIFLVIAAILGMILLQIDVISTYLESLLGQDQRHSIYMKIL